MSITDKQSRFLTGAAACSYLVACAVPVTEKVNLGNGHHMGSYPGIVALLLGWLTFDKAPLAFVTWLSNFPWFVALVGRLARGPVRWVRRWAIVGLVFAVPAVLPVWQDRMFGDYPARYFWFASFVLLAAACRPRPAGTDTVAHDGRDAEPDRGSI